MIGPLVQRALAIRTLVFTTREAHSAFVGRAAVATGTKCGWVCIRTCNSAQVALLRVETKKNPKSKLAPNSLLSPRHIAYAIIIVFPCIRTLCGIASGTQLVRVHKGTVLFRSCVPRGFSSPQTLESKIETARSGDRPARFQVLLYSPVRACVRACVRAAETPGDTSDERQRVSYRAAEHAGCIQARRQTRPYLRRHAVQRRSAA
jgi:hypothetical protein